MSRKSVHAGHDFHLAPLSIKDMKKSEPTERISLERTLFERILSPRAKASSSITYFQKTLLANGQVKRPGQAEKRPRMNT